MSGFFENEDDNPLAKYPRKRQHRVFSNTNIKNDGEQYNPPAITPCQCKLEGKTGIFCDRHQCLKSPSLHNLCRTNAHYFEMWEKGEGPMQDPLNRIAVERGAIHPKAAEKEGFFVQEHNKVPLEESGFFMGDPEIPKKSRGLGDTIAKITKATGIKKAVKTVFGAFNKDCGCSERQAKLNRMFPYEGAEPPTKTKGFFE
jgi:hypothetical protein